MPVNGFVAIAAALAVLTGLGAGVGISLATKPFTGINIHLLTQQLP
jgi:hypothetical protein